MGAFDDAVAVRDSLNAPPVASELRSNFAPGRPRVVIRSGESQSKASSDPFEAAVSIRDEHRSAATQTAQQAQKSEDAPALFTKRFEAVGPVETTTPLQRMDISQGNELTAAGQLTSPHTEAHAKNYISSDVYENDAGQLLYQDLDTGKLIPTDTNKHVVLRDPNDNRLKVYARDAETDEGRASAAGRLLRIGATASAPTAAVSNAASAAPLLTAARSSSAAVRAPTQSDLIASAASRVSGATGVDTSVPRAIASDNMAVQRSGQAIRNIPIVGDAIPKATQNLADNLSGAVQSVADQYGSGSGANVAHRISGRLGTAAETEQRASQSAALRSDAAVTGHWERAQTAANQSLDAADTNALQAAQHAVGNMSPQEMGQNLITRLRAGEQEARATKDRLYGVAGESDASVRADSVQGVHNRVSNALYDAGRVVDAELTPAANRMMGELHNFSELRIPNRVGPAAPDTADPALRVTSVNAQGMEQTRKRLSSMSQAATNDADRAASRIIMRQFDEWQGHAYDNALFSGSPEALQAARDARAANTSWRQRFFNDRDDADRIINRIATGEVTPQEVSNWVVGASQVGGKGVSSRLLTRIAEATNNDPETMQAIRGGVWNRLSQSSQGVDAKAAPRIANDIGEFINGSGRDVANRLFTPQQRGIMQAYADTLRRTAVERENVAQVAANTRPTPTDVGIGPMQELANDVLGRGGRSDEALFNAINAYAKSGGRGDIQTLARLTQALPQQDKGDLAGSIIRQLGVSPRTGQFSPDVFASQWNTYTPQAKTLLFGNAGPQRVALDDINLISDRLKQVGSKFGNPSGTAQNVNFLALASSFFAAPLTTMTTAVGGWGVAKILSSPAGASSAAKWSRSYSNLLMGPSTQTIAAFNTASRNLTNTAQELGVKTSVKDFLGALQSPGSSRANDQNNVPGPPRQ